jgi:hypothetical protein
MKKEGSPLFFQPVPYWRFRLRRKEKPLRKEGDSSFARMQKVCSEYCISRKSCLKVEGKSKRGG